jgi:hypothetical protein
MSETLFKLIKRRGRRDTKHSLQNNLLISEIMQSDKLVGPLSPGPRRPCFNAVFVLRPVKHVKRNGVARQQLQLHMYGEHLLQDTMDIGTRRLAQAVQIR